MNGFWVELEDILEQDFHGQIILHCRAGRIMRYEVHETRLPGRGTVDLVEVRNTCDNGGSDVT